MALPKIILPSILFLLSCSKLVYSTCNQQHSVSGRYNLMSLVSYTTRANSDNYNVSAIFHAYLLESEYFKEVVRGNTDLGYVGVDVCDSLEVLLQWLFTVVFENNHYNIVAVYTYMPFEMTRVAASVLLTTKIALFAHTNQQIYPHILQTEYNIFNEDINLKYRRKSSNLIKKIPHFYLLVEINVCYGAKDCFFGIEDKLEHAKLCIYEKNLDLTNKTMVSETLTLLENDRITEFTIICDSYPVLDFLNKTKYLRKSTRFEYSVADRLNEICRNAHAWDPLFFKQKSCENHVENINYHHSTFFMKSMMLYLNDLYYGMDSENTKPNESVNSFYYGIFVYGNDTFRGNSSCEIPVCGPGTELKFGDYTDRYWDYNFGWYCNPCKRNSFKSGYGNHKCHKCPEDYTTDIQQSFCYDPYNYRYMRIDQTEGLCVLVTSFIGWSCILSTIVIFYRHRKTPVVRSSNKNTSLLHLSTMLVLVSLLPLLFIGEPSNTICVCRPICIGNLLSLSSAITLSKTQKLLLIFQSKAKMLPKEVIMTKATEIMFILLSVLLSGIILIISYKVELPYKYSYEEGLTKTIYCSSGGHVIIQYVYIGILSLLSLVQAFRARKLPSSFKETHSVLYSSFLSIITLGVMLVIYYSERDYYWKGLVMMCTAFCLTSIQFAFLHGPKIYVILFQPSINDPSVVRREIMDKITKSVR